MLKTIALALQSALAALLSHTSIVAGLQKHISDQDAIITQLHTAVSANDTNSTALEAAKNAAVAAQAGLQAQLDALNAQIADAGKSANDVITAVNADNANPVVVDASTGSVSVDHAAVDAASSPQPESQPPANTGGAPGLAQQQASSSSPAPVGDTKLA